MRKLNYSQKWVILPLLAIIQFYEDYELRDVSPVSRYSYVAYGHGKNSWSAVT